MRAIDTFVNVSMGSVVRPVWLVRVAEDYFKRADDIFKDIEIPQLIDDMDASGVEKCIITTTAESPDPRVFEFPRKHPDRFAISISLDPRNGMQSIRALESFVRNEPVVLVTGQLAYPPMVMSNDEVHTGENKVDLTLTFEEIRIISPITVQGILDLAEAQVGAQTQSNAGAQPVEAIDPPADLAEPAAEVEGEDIGVEQTLRNLEGLGP